MIFLNLTDSELKALRIFYRLLKIQRKPFDKVLFALGIRHIGERTAKDTFAGNFGSIDEIMNADESVIRGIHEIGPKIAASRQEYFKDKRNLKLISKLRNAGLKFQNRKSSAVKK